MHLSVYVMFDKLLTKLKRKHLFDISNDVLTILDAIVYYTSTVSYTRCYTCIIIAL